MAQSKRRAPARGDLIYEGRNRPTPISQIIGLIGSGLDALVFAEFTIMLGDSSTLDVRLVVTDDSGEAVTTE